MKKILLIILNFLVVLYVAPVNFIGNSVIAGNVTKPLPNEKESIIPSELINKMRSGSVIAWIGAGLSMGEGYPSWTGLINHIAENVGNSMWTNTNVQDWAKKNALTNPEWVAEVLHSSNIREYYESIKAEFGVKKNSESITHALLSLLPFKGYITTNFDTLIEDNLQKFTSYKPNVYNNSNAVDLLTNKSQKNLFIKFMVM